jgi:hypothetical protein
MIEGAVGCVARKRRAPAAPYLVLIKNNSDGNRMKSRSAFEFTVRKMLRQNRKLYFWTFTLREVHSLKTAMQLWNQFLTLLKRNLGFRGVRVLELHEDHGSHFHVITNRRFPIRKILSMCERYGFGRIDVRRITDAAQAISYVCKYLSKRRERCLKGVRLWSAFGKIERTRVRDVLLDTPQVRLLRRIMGKPSVEDQLNGIQRAKIWRGESNFQRAVQKAEIAYLLSFDPEHLERQEIWQKARFAGLLDLSHPWSSGDALLEES